MGVGLTIIGVDFGTSAVRAAVLSDGEPQAVRTPDGAEEIPACVSFAQGGPHVGHAAQSFAVMQPRDTVNEVKGWLLSPSVDDLPLRLLSSGPAVVTPEHGGIELLAGGAPHSLRSVVALLLRRALELAQGATGEAPQAAVFAHPLTPSAVFDATLREAASELGLRSIAFIPEPLAAAVRLCATDRARPVFIADVGAAHTTVAVVEVGPDIEPRLLHAASAAVGGDSVTLEIVRQVTGKEPSELPLGMGELLRQYCEQMKKDLTTVETAHCVLPPMFVQALGLAPELSLDRASLRTATAALLHAVEDCCARALGGAPGGGDVELYVIGGGARLPIVSSLVEQALGTRARVSRSPTVIALGAAKQGAGKPPTRAVDDVRTRASWRPPARVQTTQGGQAPTAFSGRPSSAPKEVGPAPDALRIPMARVPVIAGATPITPPASVPPSRPPSQPVSGAQPPSQPVGVTRPISQPVIHVRPPSQPADASRDSLRAPGAPRLTVQSISPKQIDSGHIFNATTPSQVLLLPIARPMRDSDLEPITLALLLLLIGSKRRSGTLALHFEGALPLRIAFSEGKAAVAQSEVTAIGDRFKLPSGTYQFDEGRPDIGTRALQPAVSVVVSALRQLMRGFEEGDMARALGDKLDQTAEVTASDQLRMGSLNLTPLELRTVKFSLNGKNTGTGLVEHSGVGGHTVLSLLMLLDVYGLVTWKTAEEQSGDRSLADELETRAKALEAANYFQVLGVHWSATGAEIGDAHRKLRNQLSEGQPVFAAAPEACRRMLARIELAWQTLCEPNRRDAYRRQTYPDINFKGVEDLLEKKQRALELKDSGVAQAREVQSRLQEIARARSKKPPP